MQYSIDDLLKSPFEKIKRISEDGYEYWSARDLYKLLDYSEYRHFLPVIDKVKEALISLNEDIENHIEDMLDMVEIGSGAARELDSLKLSRFACYIAVQNADPSKKNVARTPKRSKIVIILSNSSSPQATLMSKETY